MSVKRRMAMGPLALIVVAVGLGGAAIAFADTTRADYIAQAEPICRANTDANRHILKGAKSKAKHGHLSAAGRQFTRAASAFSSTLDQLAAIPQPAADTAVLSRWIGYLRLEGDYLGRVAQALKKAQRNKAEGYAVRLNRNANLANQVVTGYGFSACLIDPSEFT